MKPRRVVLLALAAAVIVLVWPAGYFRARRLEREYMHRTREALDRLDAILGPES